MARSIVGEAEKSSNVKSSTLNTNTVFCVMTAGFLLVLALAIITEIYFLIALPFTLLLLYTGWTSLSFVFFLLIASIPFSTEVQISDSLGTDLPDEPLMLMVSGLAFLYLTYNSKQLLRVFASPLVLLLAALIVWTLISVLFSSYPIISIKYLAAKAWYIGAFIIAALIVWKDKEALKKSGLVLAIMMLIVTIPILIRHGFEGFNFVAASEVAQPFFRNHVNYSALLVCTIPLWFAAWKLSSSQHYRKVNMSILAILLVALFFSYARGAWLALIVGIIVYWLITKKIIMQIMIGCVLLSSVTITWLINDDKYLDFAPDHDTTIFHDDFREHLAATYKLKDLSAAERYYRWIAGVRMLGEHPITGFGPGTFYQNYRPYPIPVFQTWVSDNPERSTVHNYFLLTIVEQGIPGFLILGFLMGMAMYYSQRLFHRANDPFYKMVAIISGVIFSMILTLNFLSDLIETDKIGSLFFLCIAALVATDLHASKEKRSA